MNQEQAPKLPSKVQRILTPTEIDLLTSNHVQKYSGLDKFKLSVIFRLGMLTTLAAGGVAGGVELNNLMNPGSGRGSATSQENGERLLNQPPKLGEPFSWIKDLVRGKGGETTLPFVTTAYLAQNGIRVGIDRSTNVNFGVPSCEQVSEEDPATVEELLKCIQDNPLLRDYYKSQFQVDVDKLQIGVNFQAFGKTEVGNLVDFAVASDPGITREAAEKAFGGDKMIITFRQGNSLKTTEGTFVDTKAEAQRRRASGESSIFSKQDMAWLFKITRDDGIKLLNAMQDQCTNPFLKSVVEEEITVTPTNTPTPTGTPVAVPQAPGGGEGGGGGGGPENTATFTPTTVSVPGATNTPTPENTPVPTNTSIPGATETPTETPRPTMVPQLTPLPTATEETTPEATQTPVPVSTRMPTETPVTPVPTEVPATPTPRNTIAPQTTPLPTATEETTPEATQTPVPVSTRMPTETPVTPVPTEVPPTPTETPRPTMVPQLTPLPTATKDPTPPPTDTPRAVSTTRPTDTPVRSNTPVPTQRPANTPRPTIAPGR